MDEYYNLNGITLVSTSQFLDLDVFLRHSVNEFYNLSSILRWARDSSLILMKMFPPNWIMDRFLKLSWSILSVEVQASS